MFEYEANKFYTVTIPSGITNSGKYSICQKLYYLICKYKTMGEDDPYYQKVNNNVLGYSELLPPDWVWQYIVNGKGKYVGTFTRRISKYIKLTFGFDLSEEDLSTIGSLARDNSTSEISVEIDFDNVLGWQAGDFGDASSCYWNGNEVALELLRIHHAFAVRTWKEDHSKGNGRAWLLPPEIHGLGDFLIVLNGLGGAKGSYDYDSLWFARLLGIFWDLEYHKVYFDGGKVSNALYGSAYIVGKQEVIKCINNVTLNWETIPCPDKYIYTCNNCGYKSNHEYDFMTNNCNYYCNACYKAN